MQGDDLKALREMISQQMGMPVEQMLSQRAELESALPPEGKKLFDLIEKLFGDGAQAAAPAQAVPSFMDEFTDKGDGTIQADDGDTSITIKKGALPPPPPGAATGGDPFMPGAGDPFAASVPPV